jgi:hypothetical protein
MSDETKSQATDTTSMSSVTQGNDRNEADIFLAHSLKRLHLDNHEEKQDQQEHQLDRSCQSSCTRSDGSGYSTSDSSMDSGNPLKNEKRRKRRLKKGRKRDKNGVRLQKEQDVVKELTSMNLPYMPSPDDMRSRNEPPTLRILVVADIDMESASALAESALADTITSSTTDNPSSNPLHKVDLCIACGPFCKEDDLRLYYQGWQRRKHMIRQYCTHGTTFKQPRSGISGRYNSPTQGFLDSSFGGTSLNHRSNGDSFPTPLPPPLQPTSFQTQNNPAGQPQLNCQTTPHGRHFKSHDGLYPSPLTPMPRRKSPQHPPLSSHGQPCYPYKRSREETAALEGLVTAAISQLESIVCRVVVVPGGTTDPITISLGQSGQDASDESADDDTDDDDSNLDARERRLTPNSRNIHQRWMPLGPGLGIAGLAYMEWQKLQQEPPHQDADLDSDLDEIDDELDDIIDEYGVDIDNDEEDTDEENSDVHDDDNIAELPPLVHGHARQVSLGADSSGIALSDASTQMEMDRLKKDYGHEFCQQLQKLVESAPPVSAICETPPLARTHPLIDNLLHTPLFQSILVSQFHHWQLPDGATENPRNHYSHIHSLPLEDSESNDADEECFDPPWPSEHEAFCALPLIQEHVVLEIAAGLNSKGLTARPMEIPKGKMKVILPGSLKERGEFCLVDVAFMEDTSTTVPTARPAQGGLAKSLPKNSLPCKYRWMVRQTHFHCLNDFV